MSGAEALWGRDTMVGGMGMAGDPLAGAGSRLDTKVGYGMALGRRFVGTPRVSLRTSEYGRDYLVGFGVQVLKEDQLGRQLSVDAEHRNTRVFGLGQGVASGRTDQRVLGQARVEW